MPTGGGKSICFQVPALLFEGITLVISPLISLMKDQVENLHANGIEAAFLNSSISFDKAQEINYLCKEGKIKLLYLSPEKLVSDYEYLFKLNISLIAIDEAHCISQWGHDFRPEYTKMSLIKEHLPHVPVIALTATADKITRRDIMDQLQMENPEVFIDSFDRSNLSLKVRRGMKEAEKQDEILSFIRTRKDESGIIYCLSKKSCEKVAAFLKSKGIKADFYHAGMSITDRDKIQEDFINDKTGVICATVAFGMGIDKPNVRWVIHYNLPKSLEGFYQEIGRAGRDGLASDTILYFNIADVRILSSFAENGNQIELGLEKLNRMIEYAEATVCRRKILLSYFGEILEKDCGNCDCCRNPKPRFDGTILAQKALSAIARSRETTNLALLIDILRGSLTEAIVVRKYQEIKTFGAGRDTAYSDWQNYLIQMLHLGLFEIAYDQDLSLKVTTFGQDLLKGLKNIQLVKPVFVQPEKPAPAPFVKIETKRESVSRAAREGLLEELKKLRRRLAEEENVPAYIIFNDATLKEMAEQYPENEQEMLAISGVGRRKLEAYGQDFIRLIIKFRQNERALGEQQAKDTYMETFKFYREGMHPEEIAMTRGLNITTIYSHLAHLYTNGAAVNLLKYVSKSEIEQVRAAQTAIKSNTLKDLYIHLEEILPYYKIRLALTVKD